jgi:putative membrane protein
MVIISALLSAIHLLTLALGLGAVYMRGRALAGPLDDAGWRRLLAADNAWGVAAALWIASGLARVFFGGKSPAFYWHNPFFWLKMALFGLVFTLEVTPMATFMRARSARRRNLAVPQFPVEAYRRINAVETALVVAIVFVATLMARGVWLL